VRCVNHGYDLAAVTMAAVAEILAEVFDVDGTWITAALKCQSYATVTNLPQSLSTMLFSDAILTTRQQDTHQEYYPR